MNNTESVLLCGCGWLGEQLIPALTQARYSISATSRSKQKVDVLITQNICAAQFELGTPFPNYLLFEELSTTAILMLPVGRKNKNTQEWEANIEALLNELLNDEIDHLIFISTTSVYGDTENREVFEDSELIPETSSAKAHANIEILLQKKWPNHSSIVRLAGLIGPNRHPISSLSGRTLNTPNKVANLVHSDDIVSALLRLIELGPQQTPLHLCSLEFPQRKAYYEKSAHAFNLTPPQFTHTDGSLDSIGKTINAKASWERLEVIPKYTSPYDMLP